MARLLSRAVGIRGPGLRFWPPSSAGVYVCFSDAPASATARGDVAGDARRAVALSQRNGRPRWAARGHRLLVLLLSIPGRSDVGGAGCRLGAVTGRSSLRRWSAGARGAAAGAARRGSAPRCDGADHGAMFGTVSLAGLGLNLIAIPLAGVAVPGWCWRWSLADLRRRSPRSSLRAPGSASRYWTSGGPERGRGQWDGAAIAGAADAVSALWPWAHGGCGMGDRGGAEGGGGAVRRSALAAADAGCCWRSKASGA